ncbi:MAG: hypothetical protein U5K43_15520 [Halofilum sp. (in: g-proteobacteria)]|nr:hypothetical protein [Halofilum sp. (in: g-proteobacteria)]
MLARLNIRLSVSSLASYKTKDAPAPSNGDYEPFRRMLALTEDLEGYLIDDNE